MERKWRRQERKKGKGKEDKNKKGGRPREKQENKQVFERNRFGGKERKKNTEQNEYIRE